MYRPSREDVLMVHVIACELQEPQLKDSAPLESALRNPFQGFSGVDFYPTIFQKAAVLLRTLVHDHPFIDCNKRTGFLMARRFLMRNGYDLQISVAEGETYILSIASGALSSVDEIADVLECHCRKI